MASRPFRDAAHGFVVLVRLTPNSHSDKIMGTITTSDGVCRLVARVRAVPEDGKANKALIKLLAKQCRVRQSDISLVAGHKSRNKSVLINCEKSDIKQITSAILEE